MDFNSISKSLQDAIVNVTKEQHSLEENDIVGVIDGVRSDRKYMDEFHAHNSLGKLVAYQKAKKAELYVNGQKTKHYELNKRYDDFEPKKLAEEIQSLVGSNKVVSFPAWETLPHERLSPKPDTITERFKALNKLRNNFHKASDCSAH